MYVKSIYNGGKLTLKSIYNYIYLQLLIIEDMYIGGYCL